MILVTMNHSFLRVGCHSEDTLSSREEEAAHQGCGRRGVRRKAVRVVDKVIEFLRNPPEG
jgi:hypothetical protein